MDRLIMTLTTIPEPPRGFQGLFANPGEWQDPGKKSERAIKLEAIKPRFGSPLWREMPEPVARLLRERAIKFRGKFLG
jgi:hypothetical protein